jgi:hypothetical protein
MKHLMPEFHKAGFDFKLLLRDGDIALLRKTKPGFSFESYEVAIIQRHNGYEIAGVKIEPGENMPSSEQWGVKGWTCRTYDDACTKFNALKDKQPVLFS